MSTKPIAEVWYSVEPCDDDILRFREAHIDAYAVGDIWLLRGSERDLVVDTGCGIVPPAPLIAAIAAKPLLAVALNHSYDHSGGWHSFTERACHPLDAPFLEAPAKEQESAGNYLNDETLWSLPRAGYRVADYAMTPASPTLLVEDGDMLDLGNRALQVLHVPGRSRGGLALWEAATGSLFSSDMLYDGDHGLAWPPDYPRDYCCSLRRLCELPVTRVYPGHYGVIGRGRMVEVIGEQLAALEEHRESHP